MKRARTASMAPDPEEDRGLSKAEKRDVKKMILQKVAKSRTHNGPVPTTGPLTTGLLASAPTAILAFTNINQGNNEYNRRGDQIWIDKIIFRAYVYTTTSNDAVRFTVLRQPRSGFPPSTINLSAVWQNNAAGPTGVISAFQDDQPCQVLYDKVYTLGIAAGLQECRFVEIKLDYSKKPLRVVYQDGSATGTSFNTVMGDIELVCATVGSGTVDMTYGYEVVFHEK